MKSKIISKEFLDWNVGKGKRFETLNELLEELEGIKERYGICCGFAGGTITDEIKQIKDMISKNIE